MLAGARSTYLALAMAMAMMMRRGAGTVMRSGTEWCSNTGGSARCLATTAVRVDDDPSSSSSASGGALAAFTALLGAGALYTSCQRTVPPRNFFINAFLGLGLR